MKKETSSVKTMYADFDDLISKGPEKRWTPEADAVVLKYWPIKNHTAMTKLFSEKFFRVGQRTLYNRYQKLAGKA